MKKERSSNLELLRILCILFIIGDHFSGQSGIFEGGSFGMNFFYCAVTSLSRVACSVFIIISAWFSIDASFRFKKIIHVWLTVFMYTVPIMLYCFYVGAATRSDIIVAFFPVEESPLWFAGYYIVLVLMSPLLNMMVNKAPKRLTEYCIAVFFIFLVLYPTLTTRLGFFSNDIWILIFLYLLTGYIKKYRNTNTDIPTIKCLGLFAILWCILTFVRAVTQNYMNLSPTIMNFIALYGETYRARMNSLPNILMAYCLFIGFKNLKIKNSKLINTIASATLGVYVYHQVPCWYTYMWKHLYKSEHYSEVLHGGRRILYTIICILMVWIIGTVLELIRSKIANVLVESRNYCNRFCTAIDTFVNNYENIEIQKKDYKFYKKTVAVVSIYMLIVYAYSLGVFARLSNMGKLTSDMELGPDRISCVLEERLTYENETLSGVVNVTNTGKEIVNLSGGTHPINLGISIVDSEGTLIEQDYLHIAIENGGSFKENETVSVYIELKNVDEYFVNGYGVRFEVVQEGVSWIDDTAIYYWN